MTLKVFGTFTFTIRLAFRTETYYFEKKNIMQPKPLCKVHLLIVSLENLTKSS